MHNEEKYKNQILFKTLWETLSYSLSGTVQHCNVRRAPRYTGQNSSNFFSLWAAHEVDGDSISWDNDTKSEELQGKLTSQKMPFDFKQR